MTGVVSLRDILQDEDVILLDVEAGDKKQLLEFMSDYAAQKLAMQAHQLADVLWEREKLGTTGVGRGIAIPHGRLAVLEGVRGFFARLKTPLEFDAVDHQPVDLVFLLFSPQDAGADHLHALASVSQAMRDEAFCAQLRGARDPKDVFGLFVTRKPQES
ncbi:MAG: PTS sugar transporter subunit IIA [Alphaproteobacteria bacterium]|nr:PTS sugar transporter subunit IIA [Alphaproteobacteria bacterium]